MRIRNTDRQLPDIDTAGGEFLHQFSVIRVRQWFTTWHWPRRRRVSPPVLRYSCSPLYAASAQLWPPRQGYCISIQFPTADSKLFHRHSSKYGRYFSFPEFGFKVQQEGVPSVVDPDSVGSETFGRIREKNHFRSGSGHLPILNEWQPDKIHNFSKNAQFKKSNFSTKNTLKSLKLYQTDSQISCKIR